MPNLSVDEIKENIENSTFKEKVELLDDLYKKWIIKSNKKHTIFDYLQTAIENFNLELEGLQLGTFEKEKNKALGELTYLQQHFELDRNVPSEMIEVYTEKFTKIYKAILDAESAVGSSLFLTSSMTLEDIGKDCKSKLGYFRYVPLDYEKLNSAQSLLIYLEEKLKKREYRRYIVDDKCMCYEKIRNENGYDTHAWKPAMSIKKFIYEVTERSYNPVMWQNLTNPKDNHSFAARHLAEYSGPEFEDLTKDRNVFSFKNGVYMTKLWDENSETWYDEFFPFEGKNAKKLGASVVSSKLFDLEFEDCSDYEDWFDIVKINCPNFISVVEYQKWPEDVQRWLCILIGRMGYKIGELDDWQIIGYLIGMAGTGKSSILDNIVSMMYEKEDIGVLSNNGQKTFTLSSIVDKKIFIGPEIKEDLALDQAEFQSMVSGEQVSVNKKYKDAFVAKFDVPGMLAGNEMPKWRDTAGSIVRRILFLLFNYKVKQGDTKLGKKLRNEFAYILQACIKGYLKTVSENDSAGIWNIVPEYFKESRETMAENTNSLTHFLKSDLVTLGPKLYCRQKVFVAAFNDHCKENHFLSSKWTNQFYAGPFSDFGLKVLNNARKRYPNAPGNKTYTETFIIGIDVKNMEGEFDDDDDEQSSESE